MKILIRILLFICLLSAPVYGASAVKIFNTSGVPKGLKIAPDGAISVNLQDQITAPLILPMVNQHSTTTLSVKTAVDDHSITVASTTNMAVGDHLRIINAAADRYYFGSILSISELVVGLDTPIDYEYIVGSEITASTTNMNVDGSTTPVIYSLRTGSPSIPSSVDITRVIFVCTADSAVDLSKFGNITALTNGMVLRQVNGTYRNIFNIKRNQDFANIAYDWTVYQTTNPAQGVDGFACRLTFAGQEKMGVAIRILQEDNLQMIIQDDLTDLISFKVILEGHAVYEQ